jgi:cellulose synthase/poly-beta-1,6-N-acetylglucosamine synthase-like glycosyltransferase
MRAMNSGSERRPAVDVVVPFAGSAAALADLARRVDRLRTGSADTVTIVDNRPAGAPEVTAGVNVVRAAERQSSYFARNRGAGVGTNPWLLFLDADVDPPPDLIERYFEDRPGERTGVLAGGVLDEPLDASDRHPLAARYAQLRATMSQVNTLDGPWAYVQTANGAIRRGAFEAAGGFREHVRSGGDADLCFRLRAAGWEFEPRAAAAVVHRSRRKMRDLLRQQARHGSGAAWLERQYPGAFPRARWLGLAKWTAESLSAAVVSGARGRGDDAVVAAVDPFVKWAFELGRLFPNEVAQR